MISALFGYQSDTDGWSATLCAPIRTLFATNINEVVTLVASAEREAHNGNYVALMLSYEAASAFDSALKTHAPTAFPLAWAAVFPATNSLQVYQKGSYAINNWLPQTARPEYDTAIFTIQERIAIGDTYQVNYSFPLTANFSGDALAFYRDLCIAQGAQFPAFLDLGSYQILSLSPELFFERTGNVVRTKPMKGTVRVVAGPLKTRNWPHGCPIAKDQAENVMIVDLLRNDLGKVSILVA